MVRILPGESWKLNPSYLASLKQIAAADARHFGAPSVFDVLGIEIDGVDLTRGQSEESIFEVVAALAAVVARLCREPSGTGQVSFSEGRAELVLGRRGSSASLCLVSLARPARLLTAEVEVELHGLALATASCAQTLASDLSSINPALADSPIARRLAKAVAALRKAARLAGPDGEAKRQKGFRLAPRPVKPSGALTVGFALADHDGRIDAYRKGAELYPLLCGGTVTLRAAGQELACLVGAPFLALTDLSRLAADLSLALEGNQRSFSATLAGQPFSMELPAGPALLGRRSIAGEALPIARALVEAALDFAEVLAGRNAALADNPYLAALRDDSAERLARLKELGKADLFSDAAPERKGAPRIKAEKPLSPGSLRRLKYRKLHAPLDTRSPARAVRLDRATFTVLGRGVATFLSVRTGELLMRKACDSAHLCAEGLLLVRGGTLERTDGAGATLFTRDAPRERSSILTCTAGSAKAGPMAQPATLCVFDGHRVAALFDATGRTAWEFSSPKAVSVFATTAGERVYVAADNGFLHALRAADGHVAFRVRAGHPFERAPAVSPTLLACLGRSEAGLLLVGVDAPTGRPRFSRPLHLASVGSLEIFGKRVLLTGLENGEAIVALYGDDGGELFRTSVGRSTAVPAVLRRPGGIFASLRDGCVAALTMKGQLLWSAPPNADLDQALAPVLRRDVLLAAGDPLRAIDRATGTVLGELPSSHGVSAFAVAANLDLFAVDDDGIAQAFRLATHLAVVR